MALTSEKTILLVEDDRIDAELTITGLKQNNITSHIVQVHSGAEALDYLFGAEPYQDRSLPHLILLDLRLPKLSGIEVLRRIREEESVNQIPVVVLTCSKEMQDLVQTYDLGVNAYIRKPVDFEQFTQTVQQLGLFP